jgi:hypothetical protein
MLKRATEAGVTIDQIVDGTTGCDIWFFINVAQRECIISVKEQADGSAVVLFSTVDDLLVIPDDFYQLTHHQKIGANSCVFNSFLMNDHPYGLTDGISEKEIFEQGCFVSLAKNDSGIITNSPTENFLQKPISNKSITPIEKASSTKILNMIAAFPLTKQAMITNHQKDWPTIERDIKDASQNGLVAAKFSDRKWVEELALNWARANNKLIDRNYGSALLQGTMSNFRGNPNK